MIKKELKYATFFYNEETDTFSIVSTIVGGDKIPMTLNSLSLNRTYSMAFTRFVLRVAQRNWYRKKAKLPIDNS